MDWLKRLGIGFRTGRPVFETGQTIRALITSHDANHGARARIGDTVLTVANARPNEVGRIVTLHVTSFDAAHGEGKAERVES